MAKNKRKNGPSMEDMSGSIDHAYQHQGDSGRFPDFYIGSPTKWRCDEDEHRFFVVPYKIKAKKAAKSPFRQMDSFNKPFTDTQIKKDRCWDWKLSLLVHNNIGPNKQRTLCLRTLGQVCPICEYRNTLDEEKDDKERRALGASKRGLLNIVCLDSKKEKKKGVQLWEAPHESIIDAIARKARKSKDGKGMKFFNILSENLDIEFERKGAGLDTKYLDVDIKKRSKEDQLSEKQEKLLLKEAFNLEEIVEIKTAEELEELLEGTSVETDNKKDKKNKKNKKGKNSNNNNNDNNDDDDNDNNNDNNNDDDDEKCEYFGIKCNKLDECNECPEKIWKACYKETKKRNKGNKKKK